MNDIVRAAGGVPVRSVGGVVEVLLVHRAHHGDWSFPKGKRDPGESDEACAVREVEEETGVRCALEHELPPTSHTDQHGREKHVRWWRMRVVSGALAFLHEVDEAVWLSPAEAEARLTYPRDVALLAAALA